MPLYEYRCENGHTFEVMQRMSDDPVRECQECGAPVQRVFHPVAVHFKGSGFYATDYGRGSKRRDGDGDSSGSTPASESTANDKKPEGAAKKPEKPAKAET